MTLPDTMRALIQLHDGYAGTQTGPNIEDMTPFVSLRDIPVPTPGKGQALVKVHLAAVNPSDIHFIKGEYGQPRIKGVPAGFEAVGEVVAGDTPLIGQRVSFFATASGTWAEYALTDASGLVPCRADLAETDAAGLLVNPLTAMAMGDILRDSGTDSFMLNAAGSQLGKLLIALGRDYGIKPIAVVRRAAQAEALEKLGAAAVIVTGGPDPLEQAHAIFKSLSPRILLDAVGDQVTSDLFFAMPARARWISYGKLSHTAPALTQMGQFIFQDKKIEGFWLTRWMKQADPARIPEAFSDIQRRFVTGSWTTDVAGIVPLSDAPGRLPAVLAQPDGKAFIDPRQ